MGVTRRGFVRAAIVTVGASVAGCGAAPGSEDPFEPSDPEETLATYPQGIASGDPTDATILLWTRVATSADAVGVRVQLSEDAEFERVLVDQEVPASVEWDHTVRVRVTDLQPGTQYHYRFLTMGVVSEVGRTRTAPAPDSTDPVKVVVASCQEYVGRWYHAWRTVLDEGEEPDFVLFLGDYIYENVADPRYQYVDSPRGLEIPDGLSLDGSPENLAALTLADYRALYRQYKSDADLREIHRRFPMIVIWDDHEFVNDCWQDVGNEFDGAEGEERRTDRREAATRAWYEFLPVDVEYREDAAFPDDIVAYRSRRWGAHLELFLADTRYYRDDHVVAEGPALPSVGKYVENSPLGSRIFALKEGFDELEADVQPTMLGESQRAALVSTLTQSDATWKLWCTPLLVAQMALDLRAFTEIPSLFQNVFYFKVDQWDGFRTERAEILSALADVEGVVVVSGDLHGSYAAELRADFDDPDAPPTAVEFMATGISSISLQEQLDKFATEDPMLVGTGLDQITPLFDENVRSTNPHIRYANGSAYGYLVLEVEAAELRATFVELPRVDQEVFDGQVSRVAFRVARGTNEVEAG